MQQIGDHEEPLGPLREIWCVELAKHQWGHKLDYGAKPFRPQVGQDSSKALVRRRNQAVGSQDGVAPAFKLVSTRHMSTSQGQVAALSAELAKLKMLFDRQEVHVATYEDQYAKSNNKIKSLELLLSIAVKAAEAEHKRVTEYFNLAEPEIKELRLLEAHWQKAAGAAHADYAQLHSQMNWTRKCLQDAEARAERAEQAAATAKAALKVVETDLSTAFYQLDKAELEVAALSVSQQQLDCPCSQEPSSTDSHAQLHSTGSSARNRDGQYEFPTGRWSPDFSNVDNDGLDQGEHSDAQCVHNSNQDQPGSPCLGPAPVNNTSQGLNQPGSPRLGPAPVENTSQALDQLGSPRLGPAPVDNTSQGLDQPGSPCLSPAPVDSTSQGLDQPGSPCLSPAPVDSTSQGLDQPGSPRLSPASVDNTSQGLDQPGSPCLSPASADNTSQGLHQPGSPCLSPASVDNTSQGLDQPGSPCLSPAPVDNTSQGLFNSAPA